MVRLLEPAGFLALCAALLGACGGGTAPARGVEGTLALDGGLPGDAYVFLYEPGEGPPALPGAARELTAVPELRVARGDGRFVFGDVSAGAYRLWGFLDVGRRIRLGPELLFQPGAGDRPLVARELQLTPGTPIAEPFALGPPLRHEVPAFRIEGAGAQLTLPDLPLVPVSMQLSVDPLPFLDPAAHDFSISLADTNGDGLPEDLDGDGVSDLYPRCVLRFLPRPGQTVPTNGDGTPAEVVVPLAFAEGAFLQLLGTDVNAEISSQTLTLFVIPQAQAVFREPGGRRITTALGAIPIGDYELVVVEKSGQAWRVPNPLGGEGGAALGGPFPAQGTRISFVHGSLP